MINEFEGIWKEAADSTSTFPWRDWGHTVTSLG
jgi:hypothetical protein